MRRILVVLLLSASLAGGAVRAQQASDDAPTDAPTDAPAGSPVAVPAEVSAASAGGAVAEVEPPSRAFGHVIGDVLVQRVRLADRASAEALAATLPEGRVDTWFARLPARAVEDDRGGWALELRYQVINSPDAPLATALPALALEHGGERLALEPWPVAIGPLAPAVPAGEGELLAMRPDRRPPPLDTAAYGRRIGYLGAALGATLALWLLWWAWRRRRDRVRLPFARAAHRIGTLRGAARDEDPAAWRALHGALNETAGRTVTANSLDALIERHAWLAPSRASLAEFQAASADRFFATPPNPRPFPLAALARELARAERREAR